MQTALEFTGDEWQQYLVSLLRLRYKLELVEVPDKNRGDAGIEAFSRDGHAYQCYAPQEPLTTAVRYDKHRDKMTRDISKFIDNAAVLGKLLHPTKIRRWVFCIRIHDSKDLVAHAAAKSQEVIDAKLGYAADDFAVHVCTEGDFDIERKQYYSEGLAELALPVDTVDDGQISSLANAKNSFIDNINSKLLAFIPPDEIAVVRGELLRHYIQGQQALARLAKEFPEVREEIVAAQSERSLTVAADSVLATSSGDAVMTTLVEQLVARFQAARGRLNAGAARVIAYGTVTEWLGDCRLRLKKGTRS